MPPAAGFHLGHQRRRSSPLSVTSSRDAEGAAADRGRGLRAPLRIDVGDADARAFARHSARRWPGRCRAAPPVIEGDLALQSCTQPRCAFPSASKRWRRPASGVIQTVSPGPCRNSPGARTVSVPSAPASTCRKVSEPRCSATHDRALPVARRRSTAPRCSGRMPMVCAPCSPRRVALDEVHLRRADEAGDEQVVRLVVELERRCRPARCCRRSARRSVGHGHRLDLVVGDVDHGGRRAAGAVRVISSRICTRSAASRLDSGSSNRKALGSRTMARPMATRWRWPPESCARLAVEIVGEVERSRAAFATFWSISSFGWPGHLQAEGDVVAHGHMRIERVGLEHHGEAALGRRHVGHVDAVDHDLAARWCPRARRSGAAAWTCRSPRGRRRRRTRRRRWRGRRRE